MNTISNSGISQLMNRYFSAANAATAKAIRNISSGKRINSAADDPAGLAIGQKMNAQITGISTASRNVQDAVSMVRTADGVLGNVSDITNRMNELAVQAGNGILNEEQRGALQQEYNQLAQEIDRIGRSTNFNGKQLFDGSTYTMQVGERNGDVLDIKMGQMSASALGLDKVDLMSAEGAGKAIDLIKNASKEITAQRGTLGAAENGLQSTFNNLTNRELNLTESLSKIMDADIAKEFMNFSISNTLSQVSMAMMGNARNMMQYNVMQLLMK